MGLFDIFRSKKKSKEDREARLRERGLIWEELTEEEREEFRKVLEVYGEDLYKHKPEEARFFKKDTMPMVIFTSPEGNQTEICLTKITPEQFAAGMQNLEEHRKKQEEMNNKNPSEVTEDYWLYASNKANKKYYAEMSDDCGKWMIFAEKGKKLDAIWKEVKQLTEKGLLVDSCKVSTNKDNPNSSNFKNGVICIYTYDVNDKADLMRAAEVLFGIKEVVYLCYKTDRATIGGKYANKGDKKISTYAVTKDNYKEKLS